jgi:hypothetical protein
MDRRNPKKAPKPGMVWSEKYKMWLDKDDRTPDQQRKDEEVAREVEDHMKDEQ